MATRLVKLILPLGPGSGADIGARLFADRLSARWAQPVVPRVPGLDVLTVAELGFPIKAVASEPAVAERLAATAQINAPGNAAEFAASMEEQVRNMEAVARVVGMMPRR